MNRLESALHTLADDGSGVPVRPDLADRALNRARQRGRRRGALAATSAACVAVLITVGVAAVGPRSQHRSATGPAATSSATSTKTTPGFTKPRMNVLLIGSDAAPDRFGVRPDTIILASSDTRTGATTLFSFPPSLGHVPFPAGSAQAAAFPKGFVCDTASGNVCVLNALWTWAEKSGAKYYPADPHPGLTATKQAIEQLSGLRVDDTVVVNLKGLTQIVDAVGGVDVTVRERLPIGGNSASQQATGWIEKGRQHLDGYHALWFARSRWSANDYDRMARQQCLVTALAGQLDAKQVLSTYPKIAKALRGNLQTSIAAAALPRWAALAAKVRETPIQRVGLGTKGGTADPDFAMIRRQVEQALSPTAPSPPGTGPTSGKGGQPSGTNWMAGSTC